MPRFESAPLVIPSLVLGRRRDAAAPGAARTPRETRGRPRAALSLGASVALLSIFAVGPGAAGGDEETSPRVFVLDPEGLSVTALGLPDGSARGRVVLQGRPERLVTSPDGSRIVALDRGSGEDARFGYHPTGKSWATVLDARALDIVARTEWCWSVGRWVFDLEGRHIILACHGYPSQKPEEALRRELVRLDLQTGQVTRRLEVPRPIDGLIAVGDGTKPVVYSGRETPKGQPAVSAELRFVDLVTLTVQATLALDGDPGPPTRSADGRWLYLLEYGKPDKNPKKNVNGRLQVVSIEGQAHEASLGVGRAPRGLVMGDEGNQVFVLSDGVPSRERQIDVPGILWVIRGAAIATRIGVERTRSSSESPRTGSACTWPAGKRLPSSTSLRSASSATPPPSRAGGAPSPVAQRS